MHCQVTPIPEKNNYREICPQQPGSQNKLVLKRPRQRPSKSFSASLHSEREHNGHGGGSRTRECWGGRPDSKFGNQRPHSSLRRHTRLLGCWLSLRWVRSCLAFGPAPFRSNRSFVLSRTGCFIVCLLSCSLLLNLLPPTLYPTTGKALHIFWVHYLD